MPALDAILDLLSRNNSGRPPLPAPRNKTPEQQRAEQQLAAILAKIAPTPRARPAAEVLAQTAGAIQPTPAPNPDLMATVMQALAPPVPTPRPQATSPSEIPRDPLSPLISIAPQIESRGTPSVGQPGPGSLPESQAALPPIAPPPVGGPGAVAGGPGEGVDQMGGVQALRSMLAMDRAGQAATDAQQNMAGRILAHRSDIRSKRPPVQTGEPVPGQGLPQYSPTGPDAMRTVNLPYDPQRAYAATAAADPGGGAPLPAVTPPGSTAAAQQSTMAGRILAHRPNIRSKIPTPDIQGLAGGGGGANNLPLPAVTPPGSTAAATPPVPDRGGAGQPARAAAQVVGGVPHPASPSTSTPVGNSGREPQGRAPVHVPSAPQPTAQPAAAPVSIDNPPANVGTPEAAKEHGIFGMTKEQRNNLARIAFRWMEAAGRPGATAIGSLGTAGRGAMEAADRRSAQADRRGIAKDRNTIARDRNTISRERNTDIREAATAKRKLSRQIATWTTTGASAAAAAATAAARIATTDIQDEYGIKIGEEFDQARFDQIFTALAPGQKPIFGKGTGSGSGTGNAPVPKAATTSRYQLDPRSKKGRQVYRSSNGQPLRIPKAGQVGSPENPRPGVPANRSFLVWGQAYRTSRGVAIWNGERFIAVE